MSGLKVLRLYVKTLVGDARLKTKFKHQVLEFPYELGCYTLMILRILRTNQKTLKFLRKLRKTKVLLKKKKKNSGLLRNIWFFIKTQNDITII